MNTTLQKCPDTQRALASLAVVLLAKQTVYFRSNQEFNNLMNEGLSDPSRPFLNNIPTFQLQC
jgi:hypothetical protein